MTRRSLLAPCQHQPARRDSEPEPASTDCTVPPLIVLFCMIVRVLARLKFSAGSSSTNKVCLFSISLSWYMIRQLSPFKLLPTDCIIYYPSVSLRSMSSPSSRTAIDSGSRSSSSVPKLAFKTLCKILGYDENVDEADDDFNDYQRRRARQLLIDATQLEGRIQKDNLEFPFQLYQSSVFPRVFATDNWFFNRIQLPSYFMFFSLYFRMIL